MFSGISSRFFEVTISQHVVIQCLNRIRLVHYVASALASANLYNGGPILIDNYHTLAAEKNSRHKRCFWFPTNSLGICRKSMITQSTPPHFMFQLYVFRVNNNQSHVPLRLCRSSQFKFIIVTTAGID